jgi:hypothetical protein
MILRALASATLLSAIVAHTTAAADEMQKAQLQINRISAMAADMTARRIVSKALSDTLNIKRLQLQQERLAMNLNYGSLFLAHQLIASGASMSEIATQLKAGKTITQIVNDRHGDWKQIAANAKKLNQRIEDGLYRFFLNDAAQKQSDQTDEYRPASDVVSADALVSQADLEKAQDIYLFWRQRAAKQSAVLDPQSELRARRTYDPVRDGNQPGEVTRSGPGTMVTPPK